tara:strand:- start:1824 stop:2174 length:351 start_codon:yes stop_codon:yes gene_type:complete
MPKKKKDKYQELMLKGLKDLQIKLGSGAGPTIPTNPLKNRKYTVDKSGHVQFQNSGGKIYRPILKVNKEGKIVDSGKIRQPDGTVKINPKTYKFKNSGGKISKYYAGGGNVITGRD